MTAINCWILTGVWLFIGCTTTDYRRQKRKEGGWLVAEEVVQSTDLQLRSVGAVSKSTGVQSANQLDEDNSDRTNSSSTIGAAKEIGGGEDKEVQEEGSKVKTMDNCRRSC